MKNPELIAALFNLLKVMDARLSSMSKDDDGEILAHIGMESFSAAEFQKDSATLLWFLLVKDLCEDEPPFTYPQPKKPEGDSNAWDFHNMSPKTPRGA